MSDQTAKAIARTLENFNVSQEKLQDGVRYFIDQMNNGLKTDSSSHDYMPMIPSYITHIPDGSEKGLSLAADLGGTNFRVCSVFLNGDHSFNLEQYKTKIDHSIMVGSCEDLFDHLAKQVKFFLHQNHQDQLKGSERLKMSFTFSFPLNQTGLNKGTLIRWTKGYNIEDAVGVDIVAAFQKSLNKLSLPVDLVAITNDTVGTLLANSYSSISEHKTVLGAIFGTGTNGAYPEKLSNIKKFDPEYRKLLEAHNIRHMIINTEWGSFDNELKFLPTTIYDEIVDSETSNPGVHVFEKRISGMFLGELVRVAILDLHRRKLLLQQYAPVTASLKESKSSTSIVNLQHLPRRPTSNLLPHHLLTEWSLSTEQLSKIQIDSTADLSVTELVLQESLHLKTTVEDRKVIQQVTSAVSRRAALLSSLAIAAVVLKTGRLGVTLDSDGKVVKTDNEDEVVEVGVDGAVIEFYPHFQKMVQDGLKLTQLGDLADRVNLVIAKDGSGVGAALCTASHIE